MRWATRHSPQLSLVQFSPKAKFPSSETEHPHFRFTGMTVTEPTIGYITTGAFLVRRKTIWPA